MPASRCVHGLARFAQLQRAASVEGNGMPVLCERHEGMTEALSNVTVQCLLLGERDVTRAVIAALRDVAFVCEDTGVLAAALGAFATEIPTDARTSELVFLLQLLQRVELPHHLTDAVLVSRLREWLATGAPSSPSVTVLHDRALDLLRRLRPQTLASASASSCAAIPVNDATLITARALLAASGRLAGVGSGGYGRQIVDLELAHCSGHLLENAAQQPS